MRALALIHPAARAAVILASVVVLASLSACQRDESATGQAPKAAAPAPQLVTAMISDPKTFNPILVTDAGSNEVLSLVFEGLVQLDLHSLQIEPALAERWESNDDGTEWTFHLRPGVAWQDGVPLTAADVAFTFAAIFDPKVPNSSKHVLTIDGKPLSCEAVDERTVRFRLPRPFAPLLSSLQQAIVPKHILGDALANGTFAQQWGINTDPAKIIGTGPYRLSQYMQAQFVRFDRNPNYWRKTEQGETLPYIEHRSMLLVPDMDTAYLKFVGGQSTIHSPRPEEIADLNTQADRLGIRVEKIGLSTASQFVVFNRNPKAHQHDDTASPKLEWFTDLHFLRALAHAVDKKSMVINALSGFGEAAVSEISPSDVVFHNPNLKDYDYDLDRARAMLNEGGFTLLDGVLKDHSGHPVELTLNTNAGNKIREKMCAMLQEDWGKLGIKVTVRPVDFNTLVEKLDTTFDWDAILIGFTSSPEPHNGANLLRSSGNLHMWYPNQEQPASDWEAEIDGLVEAGSRELDAAKRRATYWRIQEILHEQLPMIQTVRSIEHTAYKRTLQGYDRTVWGTNRPEAIRFAP